MPLHVRSALRARAVRVATGLATLALLVALTPPLAASAPARVIAVGDVHGELDGFVALLEATGVIDARRRWTAGAATLVQTGDISDRGDGVRAAMDLLMALERNAPRAGGRVVALLGNHELMVLLGDFTEVTPAICAAFADGGSERRRERAWRDQAALVARHSGAFATPPSIAAQTREAFVAQWPLGCLEYREALGPRGRYGRWLRARDVAAVVEGTLYMHAGVRPDLPVASVAEMNTRVREELARYDQLTAALVRARLVLPHFTLTQMVEVAVAQVTAANAYIAEARARGRLPDGPALDMPATQAAADLTTIADWWLVDPDGPMWYRGYAREADGEITTPLLAMLARLGATHMAVGHTPTADGRIHVRAGGHLFLIDTGMLAHVYNGRPAALEHLPDGTFAARYLDRLDHLTP
ncbi:MAG: metallophosphoesterase [Vicinamibacterales bacterium]|nr:metallophosphoesterase [Vicinamibacterales bacterium]